MAPVRSRMLSWTHIRPVDFMAPANKYCATPGSSSSSSFMSSTRNFCCRFVRTNYDYLPVAQHPAEAPLFDDDSAPAAWRPMMVALRKPAEGLQRDRFHFVPFCPRPLCAEQTRDPAPA